MCVWGEGCKVMKPIISILFLYTLPKKEAMKDHASDCTVRCDLVIYSNVHDLTPAWHHLSLMIISCNTLLKTSEYLDGPDL